MVHFFFIIYNRNNRKKVMPEVLFTIVIGDRVKIKTELNIE